MPFIQDPQIRERITLPLLVLLGTNYIAMMGVGFVIPMLPIFARNLGASGFTLGLLVAGFSLSMGMVQPLAGSFSDSHGRKKFLCAGLVIFAVCGFGYNLTSSVLDITVVRFVQGIGAGMVFPVAMAYMADWAPPQYEGRYMALFNVSLMAGIGSGPVLGGILNDLFGIKAAFYGMGFASSLALLIVVIALPESRVSKVDKEGTPLLAVFRSILRDRRMRGVLLVRVSMMLAMVSSFVFLPVMMSEVLKASATMIGIVITLRTLVSASLQFPCGWLADRYNRVMLTIISVLSVAGIVSLLGFSTEVWQVMILFLLMGVGEALFLPTTSALAMEGGRSFGMGATMGVFNTALTLGMFMGSISAGLLIDQFGFGLAYALIAVMVAFTCLVSSPMMLKSAHTPGTLHATK